MGKKSKDIHKPQKSNPSLNKQINADKYKDKHDFKKAQKKSNKTKK